MGNHLQFQIVLSDRLASSLFHLACVPCCFVWEPVEKNLLSRSNCVQLPDCEDHGIGVLATQRQMRGGLAIIIRLSRSIWVCPFVWVEQVRMCATCLVWALASAIATALALGFGPSPEMLWFINVPIHLQRGSCNSLSVRAVLRPRRRSL